MRNSLSWEIFSLAIFFVLLFESPTTVSSFDPSTDLGYLTDTNLRCPKSFLRSTARLADQVNLLWTLQVNGLNYILAILKSDGTTFLTSIAVPTDTTTYALDFFETVPAGGVAQRNVLVEIFAFNPTTARISIRCALNSTATAALSVTFPPTITLAGTTTVTGTTNQLVVFTVPSANLGFSSYTVSNTSLGCGSIPTILRTATYGLGARDMVGTVCDSHTLCIAGNTTAVASDQRCYSAYGASLTEASTACGTRNVEQIKGLSVVSDGANKLTISWTAVTAAVSTIYGGWQLKIYGYDLLTGVYVINFVGTASPQVFTLPSSSFLVFFRVYVYAIGCNAYSTFTRAVAAGTSATVTNSGTSLRLSYTPVGSSTTVVQQVEVVTSVLATRTTTTTVRRSRRLLSTAMNETQDLIAQHAALRALSAPVNSVQYLGCYSNDDKGFPLVVPFVVPGLMTYELCRTEALRSNMKYFGLTAAVCFLGDIAPTISQPASQCSLPCPGNPSQKCGGIIPFVYSLYALHDFYYQTVVSYTYSTSPSATVPSSVKVGDAFLTRNAMRLINGANKFGAIKLTPPAVGARSFAAVLHGFSFPPSPASNFGLSFNYGPSSGYLPTFTYDNVFTAGSPGLSILLTMEDPVRFIVRLNGVVIENTTHPQDTLSFVDLITGIPIRFAFQVAEKTLGDPRLSLVVNSDFYALSSLSLGAAYAPDVTWTFRFAASCGAPPQNFFVHNVKLWSKKPTGLPVQVPGQYTYQGCYLDHDLTPISVEYDTNPEMTISLCHDQALSGLFEYFGLKMGNLCFLGRRKPSAPSIMCSHACLYQGSELCGGFTALSVYSVDDLTVPATKVSLMLGDGAEVSALSVDDYFGDAAASTTDSTLTDPVGTSSGSILFPGVTPASQTFVAILHLAVGPPSPLPLGAVTVGLSLLYAQVDVVCSPDCVPNPVGGLQITFTYAAGSNWTVRLVYLGSVIATAPLASTQFTSASVISFVQLTMNLNTTTGGLLLKLQVGNVASTSTVFSNVVLPSSFAPLSTWSFLLAANSAATASFVPEIYSFLAFSISGFPEYPTGWISASENVSSDSNYRFRFVTNPPAGASSVDIPLAGSNDMKIYVLRFDPVGDLVRADVLGFDPVPAPYGLNVNVLNCSSVTVSWSPVDVTGVIYVATFKDASTESVLGTASTAGTSLVYVVVPIVKYVVEVKATLFDTATSTLLNSTSNPTETFEILGEPYLVSVKYDRQYVGSPTLPTATVVWTTNLPANTYSWTLYSATFSALSSSGPATASDLTYTAVVDVPQRNVQYFIVVTNSFVCGSSTFDIVSSPFPIMIVDLPVLAAAQGDIRNIIVTQVSATSIRGSWDAVIGYVGFTPLYRFCTSVVGCSTMSADTTQTVTEVRPGLTLEYWVELYLNESSQLVKRSDTYTFNTVDIDTSNASITFLNDTTAQICWSASSQLTSDVAFRILITFLSPRLDEGPTDPILIKNISRLDRCKEVSLPILAELEVKIASYYKFDTIFPVYKSQQAIVYHYLPAGEISACHRINTHTALVHWTYSPIAGLSYSQVIEVFNKNSLTTTTFPVSPGTSQQIINFSEGIEYNIGLVTTYLDYIPSVVRPSRPILYSEDFAMCTIGDPHIETWDHLTMTVGLTGDVVLAQSLKTGMALHGRFCRLGTHVSGSWICGMSLRCAYGHDSVQLLSHQVEGHIGPLFSGNSTLRPTIHDDASYIRHGVHHHELTFTCPGNKVRVQLHKFSGINHLHLCMRVAPSYAKANPITGLAGIPNNDPTDDLILRDGTKVPLPFRFRTGKIYRAIEAVADNWRIAEHEQVFVRPFPLDDSPPLKVESHSRHRTRGSDSEDGCAAAGLAEPYLAMCRFDFDQMPHVHVPLKYNVTQHSRHHGRW